MDVWMLVKRIVLLWVIVGLIVALLGKVTVAQTNVGRTAADFLLIGPGARAAGMGGAFTAVSNSSLASYWNPAGLAAVENGEALLSHFAWYQDMSLEYGVYAHKLSDAVSMAASITYLNYGTIDGYDVNGAATGDINAYDLSGAFSVGYGFDDRFAAGATAKFVTQKLDDVNGSTFALDLGLKYDLPRLSFAAVLANVGPQMDFDGVKEKLPTSGRLAAAFYPVEDWLLTSVELEKRFTGSTVLKQGAEFAYHDHYFLRTGFSYYPSDDARSLGSGLNFGAGFKWSQTRIDYAYSLGDDYTDEGLHRFTFVFTFGP
jgi:hypothetical protein